MFIIFLGFFIAGSLYIIGITHPDLLKELSVELSALFKDFWALFEKKEETQVPTK
jgi:hypothetical protein